MPRTFLIFVVTLLFGLSAHAAPGPATAGCPDWLNVDLKKLHSSDTDNLCRHFRHDKPLLIVNTASHCGFTKQFNGLQALYEKYKDDGLVILGFPSNSFKQEEKSEAATASVCYENYGVKFPMFTHVDVKGKSAHPLFRHLAEQTREPQWNFNKYLVKNGQVLHFGSKVEPLDSALEQQIAQSLKPAHGKTEKPKQ